MSAVTQAPSAGKNAGTASFSGRVIVVGLVVLTLTLGCSSLFLRAYVRQRRGSSTTASVVKKLLKDRVLPETRDQFRQPLFPVEPSVKAKVLVSSLQGLDWSKGKTSQLIADLAAELPTIIGVMNSDLRDRKVLLPHLESAVTKLAERPQILAEVLANSLIAESFEELESGQGFREVWLQELANGLAFYRSRMAAATEKSGRLFAVLTNAQTTDLMATYSRLLATAVHATDNYFEDAKLALLKGKQISDYQHKRVVDKSLLIFPEATLIYEMEFNLRSKLTMLRLISDQLQAFANQPLKWPKSIDLQPYTDPLGGEAFEYAITQAGHVKIWSRSNGQIQIVLKNP